MCSDRPNTGTLWLRVYLQLSVHFHWHAAYSLRRCASLRETHKDMSVRILPPASPQSSPCLLMIKVSWWKNKRWGLLGLHILWSTFHTRGPSCFSKVTLHCLSAPVVSQHWPFACSPQSHPSEFHLSTYLFIFVRKLPSFVCLSLKCCLSYKLEKVPSALSTQNTLS